MSHRSIPALVCAAWLGVVPGRAADFFVNQQNASPQQPYTNWATAAVHIQEAANAAPEGSTVWIAPGIYKLPPNPTNALGSAHVLYTTKLLTLRSQSGSPDDTILDGQGTNRCLAVRRSGTTTTPMVLDGLTFRNGYATNFGGGIVCNTEANNIWPFLMRNCVLSSNVVAGQVDGLSANGGGIYSYNTASAFSFTASNCLFVGNVATNAADTKDAAGGAVWLRNMGGRTFVDCVFENNGAGQAAGGIYGEHGGTTVSNSIFRGNYTMAYSTSSSGGGGLYTYGGPIRIVNSLMYENRSTVSSGGAIGGSSKDASYAIEIVNCTIVSNMAAGVRWRDWSASNLDNPHLRLVNSIVYWNSVANLIVPLVEDPAYTNLAIHSCFSPTNLANLVTDPSCTDEAPVFRNFAARDYRLASHSPGVNAGLNEAWMTGTRDLDGAPRVDKAYGVVDMGCYEYVYRGTAILVR